MNNEKFLGGFFRLIYPILSTFAFLLMVALVFNTFELTLDMAFYNLLMFLPVYGIVLVIVRRFDLTPTIASLIAFILSYIDQYIYSFRLTHIRLSDIRLISQALHVVNRYKLVWNMSLILTLLQILAVSAFLIFVYKYYKLKFNWKAPFFAGLGITMVFVAVILSGIIPSSGTEDFDFTVNAEQRGLLYSWYCQAKERKIDVPSGYSREDAEAILARYQETEGRNDVHIIVIMNESLADYSLLGTPRFEDPLPFIHSLDKNAFEGKLAVSVYGGGTANTEFEFLTGCSTAFLPEGSTPYLQYVDHHMDSIVSDIGDVSKIAIHPYYSEEWNRAQVYHFLGFDRFISGVDFGNAVVTNGKKSTSRPSENIVSFGDGPLYVRGLISDQTCFERILEEDTQFTFAATMQNHGDYDYRGSDFTNWEYVTAADRTEWNGSSHTLNDILYNINPLTVEEELYKVNQYLTISNLSDQAFEALIANLKKSDQKTLVLMFGDHQPGVQIPEHYVDCENLADIDYVVPYILWANFDMDFDAPPYISPNYLSAVLKKNTGLGLTAWDQFRLENMKEYPVMTTNFILDKDGKQVIRDALKDYEAVQYMRMFG